MLGYFKSILRYSSFTSLSKSKTMDLSKCYFRLFQEEEKVDIALMLKVKEDNIRQFNFSRKPSETLENITKRISANISKVINKANKKNKNELNTIEINFYNADGNLIENTKTCLDLFSYKGIVNLKILDSSYEAVFNPPWVASISLPKCILAGFPVYAEQLELQNSDNQYNKYNWYVGLPFNEKGNAISDIHINWIFKSNEPVYTPSSSDIGMKLKLECTPGNKLMLGPTVETIASNLIEAGPGACPFELRHMFTASKLEKKSFRCVTYNILADLYCDSDFTRTALHPYCPPYALEIDYRKQFITKELLGYNADLICLQEVDAKIFKGCLSNLLSLNGLDGKFYKKGKEVAEGLACFYRRDRFRFLFEERIVLSKALTENDCFNTIWQSIKDNEPLLERLQDRSTVASVTALESIDNPDHVIIVGNTHLYFHPDADHIRLIQGGMCIYWLQDHLNATRKKMPDKNVSLILCGDFNSVPSCGVYQLYTTGCAPSNLPDWQSNMNERVQNLSLKQGIPLKSACGTPEYTNFTAGFADCLDYIFYETSNLDVEQVVPLPSVEELKAHTALPSIVFPSDHIALVADLKFNK